MGMHRGRTRRARVAGGIVAMALLGAACGGGGDDDEAGAGEGTDGGASDLAGLEGAEGLAAAAEDEGALTVYSSQSTQGLDDLVAAFGEAYPDVEVEVVRGIDADLEPRIEAEQSSGNGIGDLVVVADGAWVTEKAAEGWWLEPEGPELLGEGTYDAATYVREDNFFEVNAAVLTYAWNTGAWSDGLADYPDLLDEELGGGKIGIVEPSAGSIVDFYWWLEETYGEDFVDDLAAQEPRIYPSALPIGEALASGEIFAAAFAAPATLEPAKENGAPVEYGVSEEGAWGARYLAAVPTTAPNPNAAMLFANFMVTPVGQEAIASAAGSVQPDIPGTLITNDAVRQMDYERLTPENIEAYQSRWSGLFQ